MANTIGKVMLLKPIDVLNYVYCPILQKKESTRLIPPLTPFEQNLRQTILNAEKIAVSKERRVNLRKLNRAWDKVYWPAAIAAHTPPEEMKKTTVKAAVKFTDYCKYDINTQEYTTIAVDVPSQIRLKDSIFSANIDLIKLSLNKPSIVLVDLTRKNMNEHMVSGDPAILTTAYTFYKGDYTIMYICVDLSEDKSKTPLATAFFQKEDMETARRMLYHIESGIRSDLRYPMPWLCKECKAC